MFKDKLNVLPFVHDEAEDLIFNIGGEADFQGDRSFVATLRALLHHRYKDGMRVWVRFWNWNVGELENLYELVVQSNNTLEILNFLEKNESEFSQIGNELKKYFKGFQEQKDIRVFMRQYKADVHVYTNMRSSKTIIVVNNLKIPQLHALQMMIPRYIPWYLNHKDLTVTERELLKSLGEKTATSYTSLLAQIKSTIGDSWKRELLAKKLEKFTDFSYRSALDLMVSDIRILEEQIDTLLNKMREATEQLEKKKIEQSVLAIQCSSSKSNTLVDYFMANENLHLRKISTGGGSQTIDFIATGYLDIYDPEAFEVYVQEKSSHLYFGRGIEDCDMDMLLRAIFLKRILKIKVCAAFSLSTNGRVEGIQGYLYPPEFENFMRNPHIDSHGCMGTSRLAVAEHLKNRDVVGAIEQVAASARNINFNDMHPVRTFSTELCTTKRKYIETLTGELLTPKEAIQLLKVGG